MNPARWIKASSPAASASMHAGRAGGSDVAYRGEVLILDAMASNTGSPGGGVFDMQGRLIGVVGEVVESRGTNTLLNYAFPADEIASFLRDAATTTTTPSASARSADAGPGYHGIKLSRFGYRQKLPFVESVAKDSPAARGGRAGRRSDYQCEQQAGPAFRGVHGNLRSPSRGRNHVACPQARRGIGFCGHHARGGTQVSRMSFGASALVLACIIAQTPALADETADVTAEVFRSAALEVAPCVVTIETVGGAQPTESGRRASPFVVADGPTTGLIWSADGLILTSSFNFVRDPSVISVVLSDGRRFVAELLARDEIRRLAMLKISVGDLPVPQWAATSDMKVGSVGNQPRPRTRQALIGDSGRQRRLHDDGRHPQRHEADERPGCADRREALAGEFRRPVDRCPRTRTGHLRTDRHGPRSAFRRRVV
jgi:S1-C subfamily serine protease